MIEIGEYTQRQVSGHFHYWMIVIISVICCFFS